MKKNISRFVGSFVNDFIKGSGALLLALALVVSVLISGCQAASPAIEDPIRIGSLSGPTGIGMVHLMEDPAQYDISVFQNPDEVAAKFISGELDVAAVPSNLAAVLFNKLEGNAVLLATNTLGTLFILEHGSSIKSVSDLKGKTILASGKGGTPEYILNQILQAAGMDPASDVTLKWLTSHADAATTVVSEEGAIAMLPQPFVTVVTGKNDSVKAVLDLDREWKTATDSALPMGVLIAQKSFSDGRSTDLEIFLSDYADSVKSVNEDPKAASVLVAKHGVIADAAVAEKAIPDCNIVFVTAQQGKADLEAFFKRIHAMNPKSIGGSMPNETFYYDPEK